MIYRINRILKRLGLIKPTARSIEIQQEIDAFINEIRAARAALSSQ